MKPGLLDLDPGWVKRELRDLRTQLQRIRATPVSAIDALVRKLTAAGWHDEDRDAASSHIDTALAWLADHPSPTATDVAAQVVWLTERFVETEDRALAHDPGPVT